MIIGHPEKTIIYGKIQTHSLNQVVIENFKGNVLPQYILRPYDRQIVTVRAFLNSNTSPAYDETKWVSKTSFDISLATMFGYCHGNNMMLQEIISRQKHNTPIHIEIESVSTNVLSILGEWRYEDSRLTCETNDGDLIDIASNPHVRAICDQKTTFDIYFSSTTHRSQIQFARCPISINDARSDITIHAPASNYHLSEMLVKNNHLNRPDILCIFTEMANHHHHKSSS